MKDDLARFGIAMEPSLLEQLDKLAAARGCNRSEVLRDLTRAEVSRAALDDRVPAFAALTIVYNHHVRELSERLTALQHDLGDQVRSTMHVHLDHEHCLEVIVMRGRSDQLKAVSNRIIGTRGVIQGGAEYFANETLASSSSGRHATPAEHEPHDHPHPHATHHARSPARKAPSRRTKKKRG